MKTIGRFKIKDSFKITGRGLVAVGDIIEGRVKIGSFITFDTSAKTVTMKISGVEMGDTISTGEYFVGLAFVYKNENERMEFETLKLKEQIVEVKVEE
jgi:hypothetical protein